RGQRLRRREDVERRRRRDERLRGVGRIVRTVAARVPDRAVDQHLPVAPDAELDRGMDAAPVEALDGAPDRLDGARLDADVRGPPPRPGGRRAAGAGGRGARGDERPDPPAIVPAGARGGKRAPRGRGVTAPASAETIAAWNSRSMRRSARCWCGSASGGPARRGARSGARRRRGFHIAPSGGAGMLTRSLPRLPTAPRAPPAPP